ncbi:SRPBCC family protein [Massilia sp. R2A-15]|uniref:SRPBCC family protein n=1 Tax=Massilia sp. R2A-15 TaxID=3064278 RepID=UPI00273622EF|nr:SRPBCC family protein [Massilia sp. R2A-15]WLI88950.1 SRPBCC family protein [Massilia sp. R2A-15]
MIARLIFPLLLTVCLPAMAQESAVDLSVERVNTAEGQVYQIEARGEVAAPPAAVWRVLTDYNRMAEFVPDLRSARVISRSGDQAVVEQYGSAHVLFFRRDIHLVVQVREQPMTKIDVSLLDGDMKVYRCSWQLAPVPATGGTRVVYRGTMAPKFYVPGMLGAKFIRSDVDRMLRAVLARLDRAD